jgi:hypothetical protein
MNPASLESLFLYLVGLQLRCEEVERPFNPEEEGCASCIPPDGDSDLFHEQERCQRSSLLSPGGLHLF